MRGASRRNRPEPSLDAWPIAMASSARDPDRHARPLDRRVDHRRGVWHRLALRVEHAADDEHPARRRALGWCRLAWPAAAVEAVGCFLGFVVHGQGVGQDIPRRSRRRRGRARSIAMNLSLLKNMARSTSWARAAAEAETCGGLTGRELDRGLGRDSHTGGMRRKPRRIWSSVPWPARRRQDHAAAGQTAAELVARPSQSAVNRARRPTEPSCGFVEGQALEVAEHHRQTKRSGSRAISRGGPRRPREPGPVARPLNHRFDRDADPNRDASWRRPPRSCAGGRAGLCALRAVRSATP